MRRAPKALRAVGTVALFVAAVALGVVAHLDLPCARRQAMAQVDSLLAPTFRGRIDVVGLERLRLDGVDGLQVRIVDPDGVVVLLGQGVRARIGLWAVVRSALFGRSEIDVALSGVAVDHAEVNLDLAPDGILRLVHAFDLRSPTTGAAGRGVRVTLPEVLVNHAWIHGPVAEAPVVDVETLALRGALFFRNKQASIDVAHVAFAARGLPKGLNPQGEVEAHLAMPSKTGKDFGGEATFAGALGTIPVTARGKVDGAHLDAVADVPEVAADVVRRLIPEAPLYEGVGAHVEAHGDLPELDASLHATIGPGTVDGRGHVDLTATPSGELDVHVERVDVRAFSPHAPASSLGATAKVLFARASAPAWPKMAGTFKVDVAPGEIDHQVVPSAALRGDFALDTSAIAGATLRGEGTVAEDGAPTRVTFDLHPRGASSAVDFTIATSIPSLAAVGRIPSLPPGHATLDAQGSLRLSDGCLDAMAKVEGGDVAVGPARVGNATLGAHVFGLVRDPSLETTLTASDLHIASRAFPRAEGKSSGPLRSQQVDILVAGGGAPDVELHTVLTLGAPIALHATELSARRDGVHFVAHADTVQAASGGVQFDGVTIDGIGEPVWGSATIRPGEFVVRAGTKGIELESLRRLLQLDDLFRAGRLAFDVDLRTRKDGADGKVSLDLTHGSFPTAEDLSATVRAQMEGRRITADGHASLADVASLDVTDSVIQVGGTGPLRLDSWRRAWGELVLGGRVDLARLAKLLPGKLPVDEMGGQLYFEGRAARDSEADLTPALVVSARTHGLVLSGKSGTTPWRSSGIDVQLDTRVDGTSGFGELAMRAADKDGVLVSVDAKSDALPFDEILNATGPIAEHFAEAPFSATVVVPRRRLDRMPAALPKVDANGEVEATVNMSGTVKHPQLEAHLRGYAIRADDAPKSVVMGVDLLAHYDGEAADLAFKLRSPKEEVLDGDVHLRGIPVDGLLHARVLPWVASTSAHATRFPLAVFPALDDRNVRGHVSGSWSVSNLHEDAKATLTARIDDLQVGQEKYSGGAADLAMDGQTARATVSLAQADGSVEASAQVGLKWGASVVPAFDPSQKITASLGARHFSAATLAPFARRALTQLDGRIDGTASVVVDPVAQSAKLQGLLTLDEGAIQLASTGQEFHRTHARLTLTPDGLIRLDDVVAYGLSGRLTASGVARVSGLRLGEARLAVRIPKNQPIPLAVDGAEMGDVDGEFTLDVTSPKPKLVNVDVKVPTMHVRIPVSATHDVESLDAPDKVHVGVYRGREAIDVPLTRHEADEEAPRPEAPTEIDLAVHLGSDVEIRRGTQLRVTLDGEPRVRAANDVSVSGQIRLKGGTLEVQGKRFTIESGTVTFVGDDPTNPEVVVTASWNAPDGTRVYADFVGPLKTGKVTLRSEPSLPNNEILALILFGTADGASSTSSATTQSSATTAGAAASGVATEGLSRGIDELTGLDVTTRIDTSDAANPRPEVELQIAKDISLQIAFVLGTPPPGQNPDKTFYTLDWRFVKKWSLEMTVGDQGSTIADVIWQHRY